MKISGFYDEAARDLPGQIALIKELGRKYLCPRTVDGRNIASYTAEEFMQGVWPRLLDGGIKMSSIGSPIGKVAINDDEGFGKQCAQLKELIEIAERTGTQYIRCFSFFIEQGKGGAPYDAAFETVVARFKKFLSLAEGHNVILLHENEKKIYGDTAERCIKLYNALSHPQFKLCYDASNYIQCKQDPLKAYYDTKELTVYYHMKDCDGGIEVPLGTGQGRIKDIISDLKARGYDGFLTLEPHTLLYSIVKIPLYLTIVGLFTKRGKIYRKIDKSIGVGALKKVNGIQVFKIQHDNLVGILESTNIKYE